MSFGIPELLIILAIILLLFGTTKLKSLGSDLGSAIKGFRSAMSSESSEEDDKTKEPGKLTSDGDSGQTDASTDKQEKVNAGKD